MIEQQLITTSTMLEGYRITRQLGLVRGITVRSRSIFGNIAGGFQSQTYNWYGLPADFGSSLTPSERNDLINGIAPEQKYNTIILSK